MRTTSFFSTRSAIWVLAVIFAFGGIAEAGPAVLCVGEDGHTDVEYSLAGCCVSDAGSREETGVLSMISESLGCEDCVDLGLDQNSLKTGKKLLPTPEATVLRAPLVQSEFSHTRVSETVLSIGIEALITALSSVILLT